MGKPAARMGDMAKTCNDPADLPVGTVIAAGTVLINGMPAAKKGDKIVGVDTHIIMIPSPGGPVPTPLPHPYNGIINDGLSSSVKIMGMEAAMVGSKSQNMPPHIPQGGPFQKPPSNQGEIIMGSPNVLIGNGGGGSGGGSGGGGEADAETGQVESKERHKLDVKVVDKGGKPITGIGYTVKTPDNKTTGGVLVGEVKKTTEQAGDCEIKLKAVISAKWSKDKARDGETVKMQVKTAGIEDGASATFEVWMRDNNRADRQVFSKEGVKVSGGKAECDWKYEWEEESISNLDDGHNKNYSNPMFYFTVEIEGLILRSPMLNYKDYIEIYLKDENGKAIANAPFKVILSDGEIREGKLDGNGYKKIEKVPPGDWKAVFEEENKYDEET
ncbi:MAG: hypothetical protein ACOYVF_04225 [Candidatus Zixiibacteriota bacterium]